jgi:hypothetical protein
MASSLYPIPSGRDSSRFRPPKEKPYLYPLFWATNSYLLRRKHRCAQIDISAASRRNLERLKGDSPHLIIANHTNYSDVHVLWEVFRAAGVPMRWMAGIDLYGRAGGVFGFYLQSNGTFSVDRGIVDVHAIEMARATLAAGEYPLIIFPEGEANYTHEVVAPFYSGAASFAVGAAQTCPEKPVYVTPITLTYRLSENARREVEEALLEFSERLTRAAREKGLRFRATEVVWQAGCWDGMEGVVTNAVRFLEEAEGLVASDAKPLAERIETLRDTLLRGLCAEHAAKLPCAGLSYEEVMTLKNRLWSIVSRKLYVRDAAELRSIIQQVTESSSETSVRLGGTLYWYRGQRGYGATAKTFAASFARAGALCDDAG